MAKAPHARLVLLTRIHCHPTHQSPIFAFRMFRGPLALIKLRLPAFPFHPLFPYTLRLKELSKRPIGETARAGSVLALFSWRFGSRTLRSARRVLLGINGGPLLRGRGKGP